MGWTGRLAPLCSCTGASKAKQCAWSASIVPLAPSARPMAALPAVALPMALLPTTTLPAAALPGAKLAPTPPAAHVAGSARASLMHSGMSRSWSNGVPLCSACCLSATAIARSMGPCGVGRGQQWGVVVGRMGSGRRAGQASAYPIVAAGECLALEGFLAVLGAV